MNRRVTRRDFAAGIVTLPVLGLIGSAPLEAKPIPAPELQQASDRARLEAMLAKPFESSDVAAADNAIKAIADVTAQRLKKPLREGSEPCTTYVPTRAKGRP